jgi:DNA methylase
MAAGPATLPFDDTVAATLDESLRRFEWRGVPTEVGELRLSRDAGGVTVPTFTNEFWTARQRAAHSLHEVSYRACFKPQLPEFFISRLTAPGDVVYDPFMGRGTTLIQSALMDRIPYGCDVNPLSAALCEPRLSPPSLGDIEDALARVDFGQAKALPEDLLVFYHPDTLQQICALREHLAQRARAGTLTSADRWVRMVAVNRLTGHSGGFFSVYSLPPNQAVSVKSQAKINGRRGQSPPLRDVPGLILAKSRALLRDVTTGVRTAMAVRAAQSCLVVGRSSETPSIAAGTVSLAVTSPPFLDVVNYQADNWLRCWFCGIDATRVPITQLKRPDDWQAFVASTLTEVGRTLKPGGHIAFEVGEVRGGALRLEELVIPAGIDAGLVPVLVLYNAQQFTKTANCWGVTNNSKGTNTNRIVVFRQA